MRFLGQNKSARSTGAFTFVEVLAAMLFVAIVIPVAIQGVRLAGEAGSLAERKATALQIGESLLQELVATDQWQSTSQSGTFEEPWDQYQWRFESVAWTEAPSSSNMQMLTVHVTFPIRQQPFEISMSTLVTQSSE